MRTIIESWVDAFPLAKQAKLLGLKYAGHGRWKDAKTGKIVAKTIRNKIVSIKGVGEDSILSPSTMPNLSTAQPIAGDSVDGNHSVETKIDAYMDTPFPISHINKNHAAY